MPRYSVIIPVYKVEEYLSACVDSVLAQDTTSDYEVILVDDGSPDRCGAICDEYAAAHPNIRVIHQENKGLSGARNTGLAAAQGEYVIFLDSDDLWEPTLLSNMDRYAPSRPDMVLFCYERFDEQGNTWVVRPSVFPGGEQGRDYLQKVFSGGELPFWAAWIYLYRREFLQSHGFQFTQGLIYTEDMNFNLTCLPAAEKIMGTDAVLLRYRTRSGSISNSVPAKGISIRMQYDAKWFDIYPVTPLANYFALEGLSIARISEPSEAVALKSQYFRRRDILRRTTGKSRVAYVLLRVLGLHYGSKAFFLLVRLKQCLRR